MNYSNLFHKLCSFYLLLLVKKAMERSEVRRCHGENLIKRGCPMWVESWIYLQHIRSNRRLHSLHCLDDEESSFFECCQSGSMYDLFRQVIPHTNCPREGEFWYHILGVMVLSGIVCCWKNCRGHFQAYNSMVDLQNRKCVTHTVEPRYNEVLGTMKITLLYQVSYYIRVKKQRNIKSWDQQNTLL